MKKILLPILAVCFLFGANAQKLSNGNAIANMVKDQVQSGQSFEVVNLFTNAKSADEALSKTAGKESFTLDISTTAINNLLEAKSGAIELVIPNGTNKPLILELVQADVYAEGYNLVTDAPAGTFSPESRGLHYRGIVKGDDYSLAAISILDNEVMGMISTEEEGNLILGKLEGDNPTAKHIVYKDTQLEVLPNLECYTPDDGQTYTQEELGESEIEMRGPNDCVSLYIEVNKDIYDNKGSSTEAYVTAVFNQSAILYANENITFAISEIFICTSNGCSYKQNDASVLLNKFQQNSSNFNGDLAILVSYKGNGGIAAGFSGLCNSNRTQSMCMAGIQSSYNNVPTYSWTIMVFTHEIGHLMGSRHTHACVWNGNNTAIDGCAGGVEGSCPLPGNPSQGGTIMSYCHLQSVGINFNEGFGPQPGNVIRNSLAGCSTVCGGGSSTCNNGVQDGDETGVDCGGSCAPCPTCNDGVQNGGETGVDCGGPCPACPPVSCDTPDGTITTNIRRNRAKLNWNAVSGASSYDVQARAVGGAWSSGNTTGTNINFTGLSNNTTYEWQVRAVCSSGSSAWSAICTFVAGGSSTQSCGGALIMGSNTVKVYPNPANDQLNISLDLATTEQINLSLISMTGTAVKSLTFDNQYPTLSMNIADVAPGMYFIRIENKEIFQTLKVIIE